MKQKDDFIKRVIIVLGLFLLVFTAIMIYLFYVIGEVPDTLITAVFAACLGEGSICGWLKKTKIQQNDNCEIVTDEVDDDDDIEDEME